MTRRSTPGAPQIPEDRDAPEPARESTPPLSVVPERISKRRQRERGKEGAGTHHRAR